MNITLRGTIRRQVASEEMEYRLQLAAANMLESIIMMPEGDERTAAAAIYGGVNALYPLHDKATERAELTKARIDAMQLALDAS